MKLLCGILLVCVLTLLGSPLVLGGGDEGSSASQEAKDLRRAKKGLQAAVASGDQDAIAMWVEQLAAVRTPASMKIVLGVGEKYPSDPVKSAVLRALVWGKSESVLQFYYDELRTLDRNAVRRAILIIEALEQLRSEEAVPPFTKLLLNTREPLLQVAVLKALRDRPKKEAIDALIKFYKTVEDARDKVWQETLITLVTLTDQQYTLAADWENWWAITRAAWVSPKKISKHRKAKATTGVHRPKDRKIDLPQIFGQEVASKRVVFVIDCSLSMAEEDEIEGGAESGGSKLEVRIERAQRELSKVVDQLRPDVYFNMISYSSEVKVWQKKLVQASRGNKRKAQRFIQSLKPIKFTNTGAAMLQALKIKDVDTIILLSDGSPTDTKGKIVDVKPILKAIRKANRFTEVTIHTLGFKGVKESFMKSIARASGGTYAPIK